MIMCSYALYQRLRSSSKLSIACGVLPDIHTNNVRTKMKAAPSVRCPNRCKSVIVEKW